MSIVSRGKAAAKDALARGKRALAAARERWPWLDHVIRAYVRYEGARGNQLAGAVTFFGFLSFFPLLALAFAITGYVMVVYPDARDQLMHAIKQSLPGIAENLDVRALADARGAAGLIGILGLLVSGIGWVTALRESLHRIWLRDPTGGGNFIVKKLVATGVLILLGGCLLGSVAVSSLATSATKSILVLTGLASSVIAAWVLKVLAVAVILTFDTLIFLVLFSRLSGTQQPWRALVRGAVLGAIGFEVLKLVGTEYIPSVASDPVYGSFGLMVALLVWINFIARFTLFAGAWTATATAGAAAGGAGDAAVEAAETTGNTAAGSTAGSTTSATRAGTASDLRGNPSIADALGRHAAGAAAAGQPRPRPR